MPRLTQDELLKIFYALKKIVQPYQKGTIMARFDIEGKYDLWSEKELIAHGKELNEIFFVQLAIQNGYVGFYFMPVYTNVEKVRLQLGQDLLKTLKGKSCFHIKSTDKELMTQVKHAMKVGYATYKENGWV